MQIIHLSAENRFVLQDKEREAGSLEYIADNGVLNILHTNVHADYGGQGWAKRLVEAAVAYAQEQHLDLEAECTYARKVGMGMGVIA